MFLPNLKYAPFNYLLILCSIFNRFRYTHQYSTNVNDGFETKIIYNNSIYNDSEIDCSRFVGDSMFSSKLFQVFILFCYVAIFIVALVGNILVCYIVFTNPIMKSVTYHFIVNLAIGDILIDLFCVPTSLISTVLLQYWPFGAVTCPYVNYLQAVAVLVSAYTLVPISVERYIGIMWPLRPKMTKNQARVLIFLVWAISLIFASPILLFSVLDQPEDKHKICDVYICYEKWPTEDAKFYYTVSLMIFQYFVPFVILMFTYTSIIIIIYSKEPPGEAENIRDERRARSRNKMIKMILAIVIVFSICWCPFNLLNFAMDKYDEMIYWSGLPYTWVALHWLAMSHACYNPIIYFWMNKHFRDGFRNILGQLPFMERICRINECNASIIGMAPTGGNGQCQSSLRRVNTCTTYVSIPKRGNSIQRGMNRSASVRYNNPSRTSTPVHKHFIQLETQAEESV